jgi:hypothetical protein
LGSGIVHNDPTCFEDTQTPFQIFRKMHAGKGEALPPIPPHGGADVVEANQVELLR